MATRKSPFVSGEYYHVYNRGVDKRKIFTDQSDSNRFLRSMIAFNTIEPIGSLRNVAALERKNSGETAANHEPLVEIIAYCLNPNHFHLLLRQKVDGGISEFMKRLAGGYTWYFNSKYERTGSLFQGVFKSSHVSSDEYLLHVSVYVNLNFRVHGYSGETAGVVLSSWDEYMGVQTVMKEICVKDTILGQFKKREEYNAFAEQSLIGICERKRLAQDMMLE